ILSGELEKLGTLRGSEHAIELFRDRNSGAAVLDFGRLIQTADQRWNRIVAQTGEIGQGLLAFRSGEVSGVVRDQPVNNAIEFAFFVVFLRRRERQGKVGNRTHDQWSDR